MSEKGFFDKDYEHKTVYTTTSSVDLEQPSYYEVNGLSPLNAMKQGLISEDEYRGFLIGNVLKYITRFQYKDAPLGDLLKCRDYLQELIRLYE